MMHPPLLQAPPNPSSNTSSAPVRKDTPWPSAGKMLGNPFEERNWLLPKVYLVTENKKDTTIDTTKQPLKEEPKMEEQATCQKEEKCG